VRKATASGVGTDARPVTDFSSREAESAGSAVRQRAGTLLTSALVLCALASTVHLFRSEYSRRSRTISLTEVHDDWRIYADEGHVVSDRGARDTVVVFTDYQCPYCRSLESVLNSVRAQGLPPLDSVLSILSRGKGG
jgi:hypothetical protein